MRVQESAQGPIELRKKENLGRSDAALILQRKIWTRELQALADGARLTAWHRALRLTELISYSQLPEAAHSLPCPAPGQNPPSGPS